MKNQKYRQWCNRKALLAGVLAVSMAVTPMTTAFAGTGTQTAIALQDAKETSDEVVLADFDFNEAGMMAASAAVMPLQPWGAAVLNW